MTTAFFNNLCDYLHQEACQIAEFLKVERVQGWKVFRVRESLRHDNTLGRVVREDRILRLDMGAIDI